MAEQRTFGWVQEAYVISSLKDCVSVFVNGSPMNMLLVNDKIPRLISEKFGKTEFIKELTENPIVIPYAHLKGRGNVNGSIRATAPCTGIFQAALKGQRKEYQSDWPADSYARWAISLGFLDYDSNNDSCSITELGKLFANSVNGSDDEKKILLTAFGHNPPVVRVLTLLSENGRMTKFELGQMLGFKTEAGFTSIHQKYILQMIDDNPDEKNLILSNIEGTSDKYVRTIAGWLKKLGWIVQVPKQITESVCGKHYTDTIPQSYEITAEGLAAMRKITGVSRHRRIERIVPWEMLSTKAPDTNYIRNRRTYLIKYLQKNYHSIEAISKHLETKGISEPNEVISEDITGLINIGLKIDKRGNEYKLADDIVGLAIPANAVTAVASDNTLIKNTLRNKLTAVDHKYLVLIDFARDRYSSRDFEIMTADLFNYIGFNGKRLGDARKPDVCIYKNKKGLIIDNKAYSDGFSLPINQADEMIRYIDENKTRDINNNPNKWWEIFPTDVSDFGFAFVSSNFTGGFKDRIDLITARTGYKGGCVTAANLLLFAEEIKSGRLKYDDGIEKIKCNGEVIV
ncbi:MAG: restriction endonuclease [Ruminococcus sp.]|nr:restriction endonuclease [Ruminococcus sp.]